jgi:hypothetical protein
VSLTVWIFVVLVVLGVLGLAGYLVVKHKRKNKPQQASATQTAAEKIPFQISYVPSDMEWSGSTSGTIPLKTLTYKQYECLEDARYGFKIVGVTPTERKNEQPHKTRAHGQKTVASLARHGFLISNGEDGFVITDHGLNALEVCDVRY